ncbi:MAG: hypothetical protein ACM37U_12070 [Gemmatimonas sp.]
MAEIKRPNYFTSQFLVEKDFDDEQAYHLDSRRRHNRVSHTFGVADRLAVTLISGRTVQVSAGTAIDKDGREIVLNDPVTYTLGTGGAGADVYLTIAYQDVLDPTDKYAPEPDLFTRTTERPLLQDGTAVPSGDGSVILLARIHLNTSSQIDNGSIDTSVRTVSSAKLGTGVVTVTQLGDGAVNTTKLADAAVTNPKLGSAAVQSANIANYAVGSVKLDGFARGQHGVYLETFENLPSDWTAVQGTGVESIVASGVAGGQALRVVGHRWRVFPQNIPFDPSKLYRIRARLRPITHATDPAKEQVFIGVQGVAADGVTLVNIAGVNTTSNQHYVCVPGTSINSQPLGNWLDFTGWFRGHAAVGSQGGFPNPTAPGQLHTNVRYFRPLFILGFSNGDGTAELDSIAIDVFDEDGVVRTYSGLNADGTVAANKVVANSIAANQVGTPALVDGAVTTPKIAALNVTGAQLAPNAVDGSKIQDGVIVNSKLGDGEVTIGKLASNSVDASKIVANSIGTNQLATGAVLSQNIAAGAVGPDKLAAGSVGISAFAVIQDLNEQRTISANSVATFLMTADVGPTHRFHFISVVCLTANGEASWEERASTGTTPTFSRIVNVTNRTGITISVAVRAYTLLL